MSTILASLAFTAIVLALTFSGSVAALYWVGVQTEGREATRRMMLEALLKTVTGNR